MGASSDSMPANDPAAAFDGSEPLRLSDCNICFTELQAGAIDEIAITGSVKIVAEGVAYI